MNLCRSRCDQIGLYWKVSETNFITNIDQNVDNHLGFFKTTLFNYARCVASFSTTIGKLGYFLFHHLVALLAAKMYQIELDKHLFSPYLTWAGGSFSEIQNKIKASRTRFSVSNNFCPIHVHNRYMEGGQCDQLLKLKVRDNTVKRR